MQSLLQVDPFPVFDQLMEKRPQLHIDIILTVPEFMLVISQNALNRNAVISQYGDTINALERFYHELPVDKKSRVNIRFHPGVSSLSSVVRDSMIDESAVIAFVPKWTTDIDPDNRVFCLVSKADNRELFNKIIGHIAMMRNPRNSMTLEEMVPYFRKFQRSRLSGWKRWFSVNGTLS